MRLKIAKAAGLLAMILASSLFALWIGETALTKNKTLRKEYGKRIDPEPFQATINPQGFRAESQETVYEQKHPGILRIICLGDSFTYGHGVADSQAYPVYLEKILRERGLPVQVINAGLCGATIDDEREFYSRACRGLEADLVLLLVTEADSRLDYAEKLYKRQNNIPAGENELRLSGSKIYDMLKLNSIRRFQGGVKEYYLKHKKEVIAGYLDELGRLNSQIISSGARLAVVSFDYLPEEITRFFSVNSIVYLDVMNEYIERAARGGIKLVYHHNAEGNRFLAGLIARKLEERKLLYGF